MEVELAIVGYDFGEADVTQLATVTLGTKLISPQEFSSQKIGGGVDLRLKRQSQEIPYPMVVNFTKAPSNNFIQFNQPPYVQKSQTAHDSYQKHML